MSKPPSRFYAAACQIDSPNPRTRDEISARTWVRESDGVVLRQEATQHGDTWILDRD